MTGYQEILTDPSYKGQIVTMTYPLIGNYGVNEQDVESWRPHVAGFVIRELSPVVSNWRADYSLADYLEQNGIPGIQGIDTRALTKKLRVRGAMKGFISTENVSDAEAVEQRAQLARAWSASITSRKSRQREAVSLGREGRAERGFSTGPGPAARRMRATCASRCRRRTFRSSRTISG